jgi:glycosyltransferase involved in cell wall biosynthesis
MKSKTELNEYTDTRQNLDQVQVKNGYFRNKPYKVRPQSTKKEVDLTKILIVTSYPPRVCGIATYSQDLVRSLNNKFSHSLLVNVCALESGDSGFTYPGEVKAVLNTENIYDYKKLALTINEDNQIKIVLIQHEFGFFNQQEMAFLTLLYDINKPVIVVFHTVLPHPDELLKTKVHNIASACESIVVMTKTSAKILAETYNVSLQKISIIAHGTHLVPHLSPELLKRKYGLKNRKVLSTFGLLSSGKSIETTIEALPAIILKCPEVVFLVIGKTHPEVVKREGESYREKLEARVSQLNLAKHVIFINKFLALPDLLDISSLPIYTFLRQTTRTRP